MSIRSIPYAGKRELPTIGPHCALPVAEFARFGCGKTATRPSDESFYKDSIIGLSFLKFDQNYSLPKERRELCDLYEKQALVNPRDRTSTLPTLMHGNNRTTAPEPYAPNGMRCLPVSKFTRFRFSAQTPRPPFPTDSRKQR